MCIMLFRQKYHYFLFVFHHDGELVEATICFKNALISHPRLIDARRKAGVSDTAVVMNISYLGQMSKREYEFLI